MCSTSENQVALFVVLSGLNYFSTEYCSHSKGHASLVSEPLYEYNFNQALCADLTGLLHAFLLHAFSIYTYFVY